MAHQLPKRLRPPPGTFLPVYLGPSDKCDSIASARLYWTEQRERELAIIAKAEGKLARTELRVSERKGTETRILKSFLRLVKAERQLRVIEWLDPPFTPERL